MFTTLKRADWIRAAEDRYGGDPLQWRFSCPVCRHVASVQDWKDAKAPDGAVAFSCIGRYLPAAASHAFGGSPKSPCDYAGGGLFRLNPIHVVDQDGREHEVFDFVDRPLKPREAT